MKIKIQESNSRGITFRIPTRLLLSPGLINFGLKVGRKYSDAVPDIPSSSIRELRRILLDAKKRKKGWVLVDVDSADGDKVKIEL